MTLNIGKTRLHSTLHTINKQRSPQNTREGHKTVLKSMKETRADIQTLINQSQQLVDNNLTQIARINSTIEELKDLIKGGQLAPQDLQQAQTALNQNETNLKELEAANVTETQRIQSWTRALEEVPPGS
ncbi:MAG: hypothetical protein SFU25_08890 [Candidatus Caenarcaniphilales bacterium]|nr:hypothetical protein [Candidatus Caenarcaniphilales bacterium]